MIDSLRQLVKSATRRAGYQVHKSDAMHSGEVRRDLLLRHHGIDLVLDVGANRGQYGTELRNFGYRGRIVSFEPLQAPFQALEQRAGQDDRWRAMNCALGDASGTATLNVSRNNEWSSLLGIAESFADAPAGAAVVDKEDIRLQKLDDIYWDVAERGDRVYLKIDTQGYERKVLEGAAEVLPHIRGVQMEMSLERFYDGENLFQEMLAFMNGLGFTLMSVNAVNVSAESGRIRQLDGIFYREA